MYSFGKYTKDMVIYHNLFTNKIPGYLQKADFDAIIFHQSLTLCGDRERYVRKIKLLRGLCVGLEAVKVALFQDEYINTDMSVRFLNELRVEYAFSVAPCSEWGNIYRGLWSGCTIYSMLTGYVDEKPSHYYKKTLSRKRNIDIGYRVVWDKLSVVLGKFGYDKVRIAECFLNASELEKYRLDIKVGSRYLIQGKAWNRFLSSCRYVLGVESGGSVLDVDGSIMGAVAQAMEAEPDITSRELYERYIEAEDGQFNLRSISPRHFEAIGQGACQILYEGWYSGILLPGVHYIPLKKDHSNFEEVVKLLADEEYRRKMVQRAFRDIIESDKYTYRRFVDDFYNTVFQEKKRGIVKNEKENFILWVRSSVHEIEVKFALLIITIMKKRNILKWAKSNKFIGCLLDGYYAARR